MEVAESDGTISDLESSSGANMSDNLMYKAMRMADACEKRTTMGLTWVAGMAGCGLLGCLATGSRVVLAGAMLMGSIGSAVHGVIHLVNVQRRWTAMQDLARARRLNWVEGKIGARP